MRVTTYAGGLCGSTQFALISLAIWSETNQVGLMGKIYTQAAYVVVWLGQADLNSDLAADYIKNDSTTSSDSSMLDIEQAVHSFLLRPYWSRVWIFQEIMLARDIIFLCGHKSFTWHQMSSIRRAAKGVRKDQDSTAQAETSNRVFLAARDAPGWLIIGQRSLVESLPQCDRRFPLVWLFTTYTAQQSADDRDGVYGLLGIANQNSLKVDYGVSNESLYIEVLRAILDDPEALQAQRLVWYRR
ncbi:hypothetical protein B0H66DRAFT_607796 [Apodospora peruviana]|uniref:Heterokaryon incompatibility domain-containing protein n=1 Tax=Apodospora peruviana TaxID=516989 RepID=A0AAE0HTP6_9PEZI|nr:hypothetical protein B0H66DRAFT_607796 [Apodospora peruviana]